MFDNPDTLRLIVVATAIGILSGLIKSGLLKRAWFWLVEKVAYQWYWWTQCWPALRAMDRSVRKEMKENESTNDADPDREG